MRFDGGLLNISWVCVRLPAWHYRGVVLNLKQQLTDGKQLFAQVLADAFLCQINICIAVLVLFLFSPVQS